MSVQPSNPETLVQELLAAPPGPTRERWLLDHASCLDDRLAEAVKAEADRSLRVSVQQALQVADALAALAAASGQPGHRGLSLLAEANARGIGLGDHRRAVELYDAAAALYAEAGMAAEAARAQVGKVWSLAALGRYDEALAVGRWAREVLAAHGDWLPLARLTANLAAVQGRLGRDAEALALLDEARRWSERLPELRTGFLARLEHNRAIVLRNLGRFDEAIQASQRAAALLQQTGQSIGVARARQNLAVTYFVLGRYNEALDMLDRVRDAFLADGRERDAALVNLFICDCLLQLRRFADVLERCAAAEQLFERLGTGHEQAQALVNHAVAAAGLRRFAEAHAALAQARAIFEAEGNQVLTAHVDLEEANVLFREGHWLESQDRAAACAAAFARLGLAVEEARASLAAARAAHALGDSLAARRWVARGLAVGQQEGLPSLTYQAYHLLGSIDRRQGNLEAALAAYTCAVDDLERLRSRLMVEHRVDFLEDKEEVYEDAVDLCLALGRADQGLSLAERAKSRALQDLVAGRLDISLRARSPEDEPLVAELIRLRNEYDRLHRRRHTVEEVAERGWAPADEEWQAVQGELVALERRITELWHRLLVRSADYAREAALWQVHVEPVQPFLPDDAALVEYFVVRGHLVLFVATADAVQAFHLAMSVSQAEQLVRLLRLNVRSVRRAGQEQMPALRANAQGLLARLYQGLVAPAAETLAEKPHWVVVPHGPLHYLPFHALHDGQAYLCQRHILTYLPSASLLRYCGEQRPATGRAVAFGHSCGGLLPYAVQEAAQVADLLDGAAFTEEQATLEALRRETAAAQVLHLATHGDFRPDSPLFSGLALADGMLTTLDIFSLSLQASLVTLSACRTGRSVVGGGDELLGLTRAFLYAGAASLVLSQWAVEDRSTALLMNLFYRALVQGRSKGAALREAQSAFIAGAATHPDGSLPLDHPYFWAPFFLVGAAGAL